MASTASSKDAPTHIPNEDFSKLKRDILTIRAEAIAKKKRHGKITDEDRKGWEKRFSDIAYRRPFLFYMATDVERTPDISLATNMIDALENQRKTGDLSYQKSTRTLINMLSDKLNFPDAKRWLPSESASLTQSPSRLNDTSTPEPEFPEATPSEHDH